MTDRLKGVWVAFEKDIREDDAEAIIQAIKCLRGVIAVEGDIADANDWINRMQIRTELGVKLWAVLYPKDEK
jgi:hypothetical protein